MADKKPAGKPSAKPSGGGGSSEGQMVFVAAIAVVILFVVLPTVLIFFGYSGSYSFISDNFAEKASNAFSKFVDIVSFLAIFISLLFIMGMMYAKTRYKEITEAYNAQLKAMDEIGKPAPLKSGLAGGVSANTNGGSNVPGAEGVAGVNLPGASVVLPNGVMSQVSSQTSTAQVSTAQAQTVTNPRWVQIEKNMQSHNLSEWRVAILEADILLFDMLSQMGYDGTSIGEILKKVDKANFVTLDDAWKAHRIRNIIAHEGANYELSRDEAERTIRLYKRVFDEFYFV